MTDTVPYQPGMSLGRTFDLRSFTNGQDIFPIESTSNPQSVQSTRMSITCKAISTSADVKELLDISGELSLKIKAGLFKLEGMGMGSYLNEDRSDDKTLEVLIRARMETVTESLTSTETVSNWKRSQIGTHYIRSITYGGDLIVRIRIRGRDSTNLDEVKAKVHADLLFGSIVTTEAKANFKKLEQDLTNCSEINISYFSTTIGVNVPRDIDGIFKVLEDFPNQVLKLNGGKGVPLRCELIPLTQLDASFPEFVRQKCLMNRLASLEEQYDDTREAEAILKFFLQRVDLDLSPDQDTKAKELEDRIDTVMNCLNEVITHLDVTSVGNSERQIKDADKVYKEKKTSGGFRCEVRRFIHKLEPHKMALSTPMENLPPGGPVHIVLLGKTGHGKSATGNTIFGEERFQSVRSFKSVTQKCQLEHGNVGGRMIYLVDTPGTMDTKDPKAALDEIGTAIAYCPKGFHAFILVLRPDMRMTSEEWMTIMLLKRLFGEDVLLKYTVLVFTHGDTFVGDKDSKDQSLLEYLKSQGKDIAKLVNDCKERCVLINNREKDPGKNRKQIIEIISLVDRLQKENNGKMYTNDLFKFASQKLEEEKRKIKEKEEKIKRQEEELKGENKRNFDKIRQLEIDLMKLQQEKLNIWEIVGRMVSNWALLNNLACFPPGALVKLQDGRIVSMANLQVGHKVLSSVSNGKLEYSEICFFAHLDPESQSQYICISASRYKLKLTPGHHIFIVGNSNAIGTVPAGNMNIGDRILVFDEETSSLQEEVVTNLSRSSEVGIYAPITMSGTIIVDNVLASCYVDIVPPKISHPLLWPVRKLYQLSPSLSAWVNMERKEGMPVWVKWIIGSFLRWRK